MIWKRWRGSRALFRQVDDTESKMAKPLGSRSGAGFRPGAIVGAVFLSLVLLLLFDLISHAHF
jgi:hypothetical protein